MHTNAVNSEWRVPDEMWPHIEALLPLERPKSKGSRPRMPDRQAMDAIPGQDRQLRNRVGRNFDGHPIITSYPYCTIHK